MKLSKLYGLTDKGNSMSNDLEHSLFIERFRKVDILVSHDS